MTIESIGYAGTIMPNDDWAHMQWAIGMRYWVGNWTNCVVSGVTGGSNQVQVATGYLGGWGILDNVTEVETLTLPTAASGSNYYMIVARRTWQDTQATTIEYIDAGTSLPSALPTRQVGPGVEDDQPLALVKVTAGQSVPAVTYDLRAVGAKDYYDFTPGIPSPNWFSYLAYPGNIVRVGNVVYTRILNRATGNAYWETDPTIVRSGPGLGNGLSIGSAGTGWALASEVTSKGTRSGNQIQLLVQARRVGSNLSFTQDQGNVVGGDLQVFQISDAAWKPPHTIPATFEYVSSSNATYQGAGYYTTGGLFTITSGAPATNMTHSPNGDWSMRVQLSWIRES